MHFDVETIKARDFKDTDILKEFKLHKRCVTKEEGEDLVFYCRNTENIFKVKADITTSKSLVFEVDI